MKRKADEKISRREKADLEENEKDEPVSLGKNVNYWLNEMGVRQEATQEGTEGKRGLSGKEK